MRNVDQERLERWLIRKTQKMKDKQKNRQVSADHENKQIGKIIMDIGFVSQDQLRMTSFVKKLQTRPCFSCCFWDTYMLSKSTFKTK